MYYAILEGNSQIQHLYRLYKIDKTVCVMVEVSSILYASSDQLNKVQCGSVFSMATVSGVEYMGF